MQTHSSKWGQDDKIKMEANDLFAMLKTLLEKKLNVHWHSAYLEKYVKDEIIPFGLRLRLFPHFPIPPVI